MNDRLISAETLLTKYQELCKGLACIDCPFYGIDNRCRLESMILQEQIVDAVPVRHGHWVHGREISRSYIGDACVGIQYQDWKCSSCGIVCEQSGKPLYNYCPHCGAKMDEVKDGD